MKHTQNSTPVLTDELQQLQGNNECTKIVLNLMDEIRELKKNLSVVESILRSSLPIVGVDKFAD